MAAHDLEVQAEVLVQEVLPAVDLEVQAIIQVQAGDLVQVHRDHLDLLGHRDHQDLLQAHHEVQATILVQVEAQVLLVHPLDLLVDRATIQVVALLQVLAQAQIHHHREDQVIIPIEERRRLLQVQVLLQEGQATTQTEILRVGLLQSEESMQGEVIITDHTK